MLTAQLERGNFEAASDVMLDMEQRFQLEFKNLGTIDDYSGFVASKAYPKFQSQSRAQRAPPY